MGFLKFLFPVCFFWYFLLFGSVDIQHFTIRKQILKEEHPEMVEIMEGYIKEGHTPFPVVSLLQMDGKETDMSHD